MGQVFGTVGKLQLIETITLGAAGTTMDFTGLSGNDKYVLMADIENNTATGAEVMLCINNDTTTTNYYTQAITSNGASITASRLNQNRLMYLDVSETARMNAIISRGIAGYVTADSNGSRKSGATIEILNGVISKTATVADITQLTIISAQNMKIGSTASLYKVVE